MTEVPKKLLAIFGTRPEAIKLAPLILQAKAHPKDFRVHVVATGQHREMLNQMLEDFDIDVDANLEIMSAGQSLCEVTSAALRGLCEIIEKTRPDCAIVQGDTTTTLAGAMAAFYNKVRVAHVEAGLRTHDRWQPYPEEVNRCLTTQLTDFHFAPTSLAEKHLLREGVRQDRIWVTGNTGIDALFHMSKKVCRGASTNGRQRTILLTAHRRENIGAPLKRICDAVLRLVDAVPDVQIKYPVHLNPAVRDIVFPKLEGHPRIQLTKPLSYREFVLAMNECHFILTDSGGIQEEAPSLGKPVLVLREKSERPEAIEAGTARLVGSNVDRIVEVATSLLTDGCEYERVSQIKNPYGNGTASETILDVLSRKLHGSANTLLGSS